MKLEIKGFKSYSVNNPITIDLSGQGIIQIAGKNGKGKSNIVDALLWCLTEKTIKKIPVDKVIPWYNKKEYAYVTLTLDKYIIERFRKHPEWKTGLRVTYNGKLIPNITQKQLDKMLGIDYDTIISSIVFSAEDFNSFIEFTPLNRKAFIEQILGIDKFDKLSEAAKEIKKEKKDNLREIISQREMIVNMREKCKIQIASVPEADRILQLQNDINNLQESAEKYQKVLAKAQEIKLKFNQETYFLSSIEKEIQQQINEKQRNKSALEILEKGICHTCNQPFRDEERIKKTKDSLNQNEKELARLADEKIKLIEAINENSYKYKLDKLNTYIVTNLLEEKNVQYNTAKTQLAKLNVNNINVVSLNDKIIEYSTKIEELDKSISHSEKLQESAELIFDGINNFCRLKAIEQYMPIFNSYINTLLKNLFVGHNIVINFDSELNATILFNSQNVQANQLSTGQRARINFAICLATLYALRKIRGINLNIAFFDEVLDTGLDEEGQKIAFELLNAIDMKIFVISHKSVLSQMGVETIEL